MIDTSVRAPHPRDRDPILAQSVFPILPWQQTASDTLAADVEDEVGTAFCISEAGWFVTAEHLLRKHESPGVYKILLADDAGRITHFASYGYDEVRDVGLFVRCGEVHTPYPDDLRSRDEIARAARLGEEQIASRGEQTE